MTQLKFISFLLFPFIYFSCKCYGDACSGSVAKGVGIQMVDKITNKSLNANAYNIALEGFPFASPQKNTGKDSSIVTFGDGAWGKKGEFNGVIKIDGVIVGKFLLTLIARDCCGDYPETGTIEVKEGNLVAKAGGDGSKIFNDNKAFFILKL